MVGFLTWCETETGGRGPGGTRGTNAGHTVENPIPTERELLIMLATDVAGKLQVLGMTRLYRADVAKHAIVNLLFVF